MYCVKTIFFDIRGCFQIISVFETTRFNSITQWAFGAKNDVVSTLMRRSHVASTLIRRHFYVMCPLGRNTGSMFLCVVLSSFRSDRVAE